MNSMHVQTTTTREPSRARPLWFGALAVIIATLLLGWQQCGGLKGDTHASDDAALSEGAHLEPNTRSMDIESGDTRADISGLALLADSRVPSAHARVMLTPVGRRATLSDEGGSSSRVHIATADSDGLWLFESLAPGAYNLTATARGARTVGPLRLNLSSGEDREDLVVELVRGGHRLHGVVEDVGGGPIPGARVSVTAIAGVNLADAALTPWATLTDDEGGYEIFIPAGASMVEVQHPDYAGDRQRFEMPASDARLNVALLPGSAVEGTVVRASDGAPVANAEIHVTRVSAGWDDDDDIAVKNPLLRQAIRTDAAGRFRISGLRAGVVELRARAPGLATPVAREVPLLVAETSTDLVLTLSPALRISGRVVERGSAPPRAVAGVTVVAVPLTPPIRLTSTGPSRADGRFEIEGVSPGTYFLLAAGESGVPSVGEISVRVVDQDVDDVTVPTEAGVFVAGRVTPPAVATISVEFPADSPTSRDIAQSRVNVLIEGRSDPEGTFRLGPFPRENAFTLVATDAAGATGTAPVVLGTEDLEGVVLSLAPRGTIEGRVVTAAGEPAVGVTVDLTSNEAEAQVLRSFGRLGQWSPITGSDGTFSIKGLDPGSYDVAVRDADRSVLAWHGATGEARRRAKVISVAEGESREVELIVTRPDGVIEGTVVDSMGRPVADAVVRAVPRMSERQHNALFVSSSRASFSSGRGEGSGDSGSEPRIRYESMTTAPVFTGVDGEFEIPGLHPVDYDVIAEGTTRATRAELRDVQPDARVELTLEGLHTLSCAVTQDGEPVAALEARLKGPDSRGFGGALSDGRLIVERLSAGTYEVTAHTDTGVVRTSVEIPHASVDDCTIEMERLGVVTGSLVDAVSGRPVPDMKIVALGRANDRGALAAAFSTDSGPMSDAEGVFRVERVSPGRVTVLVYAGGERSDVRGRAAGFVEPGHTLDLGTVPVWTRTARPRDATPGTFGMKTRIRDESPSAPESGGDGAGAADETTGAIASHLWVTSTREGGAARLAGIRTGDEIVRVDDDAVAEIGTFSAQQGLRDRNVTAGQTARLVVRRAGDDETLEFTLVATSSR